MPLFVTLSILAAGGQISDQSGGAIGSIQSAAGQLHSDNGFLKQFRRYSQVIISAEVLELLGSYATAAILVGLSVHAPAGNILYLPYR